MRAWWRPAPPTYRVAVRARRPRGIAESFDMALYGRRWSWWCTCDGAPHHHHTQPQALQTGLAHLADAHPTRRRGRTTP